MPAKSIGPTFANELAAYGTAHGVNILGVHFAWHGDGTLEFFDDTPQAVVTAVEAVYAAHDPATETPDKIYADKIALGIALTSTGNPGLNATYALDDVTLNQIAAVARDSASGLGLPQDAPTFTYPDITGNMTGHNFSETNIIDLYKAMRDLVAQLQEQLAVAKQGGTPSWPSQAVTIA